MGKGDRFLIFPQCHCSVKTGLIGKNGGRHSTSVSFLGVFPEPTAFTGEGKGRVHCNNSGNEGGFAGGTGTAGLYGDVGELNGLPRAPPPIDLISRISRRAQSILLSTH